MWTEFEPGTPGRKANILTTELKRILHNAVISSFIDDGKPIR